MHGCGEGMWCLWCFCILALALVVLAFGILCYASRCGLLVLGDVGLFLLLGYFSIGSFSKKSITVQTARARFSVVWVSVLGGWLNAGVSLKKM